MIDTGIFWYSTFTGKAVLRIHISFHLDPDPGYKTTPFGSGPRKDTGKLLVTSMIFKTLEVSVIFK